MISCVSYASQHLDGPPGGFRVAAGRLGRMRAMATARIPACTGITEERHGRPGCSRLVVSARNIPPPT